MQFDIQRFMLPIKGNSYKERKESARNNAIEWSTHSGDFDLSYSECQEIYDYFRKIGKRYGLLREFTENGIC